MGFRPGDRVIVRYADGTERAGVVSHDPGSPRLAVVVLDADGGLGPLWLFPVEQLRLDQPDAPHVVGG